MLCNACDYNGSPQIIVTNYWMYFLFAIYILFITLITMGAKKKKKNTFYLSHVLESPLNFTIVSLWKWVENILKLLIDLIVIWYIFIKIFGISLCSYLQCQFFTCHSSFWECATKDLFNLYIYTLMHIWYVSCKLWNPISILNAWSQDEKQKNQKKEHIPTIKPSRQKKTLVRWESFLGMKTSTQVWLRGLLSKLGREGRGCFYIVSATHDSWVAWCGVQYSYTYII